MAVQKKVPLEKDFRKTAEVRTVLTIVKNSLRKYDQGLGHFHIKVVLDQPGDEVALWNTLGRILPNEIEVGTPKKKKKGGSPK
jgi:hypothetical protein